MRLIPYKCELRPVECGQRAPQFQLRFTALLHSTMEGSTRNSKRESSGSSDTDLTGRAAPKRSRSYLFCDHCEQWVSKSTFYRHKTKGGKLGECTPVSPTYESSGEDTVYDDSVPRNVSANDSETIQSVPATSPNDSSTESSDDSSSDHDSIQQVSYNFILKI